MDDLQLKRDCSRAANRLRSKFKQQRSLWQQVPHWELEAQGRTGWQSRMGYAFGVWFIRMPYEGRCIAVECATGEIVVPVAGASGWQRASDDEILAELRTLRNLDAQELINSLRSKATMDRPSYYSEAQWAGNEQTRQQHRKQYSVSGRAVHPARPLR